VGNRTRARRATAIVAAAVTGLSVVVVHPGAVFSAPGHPAPAWARAAADDVPTITSFTPTTGSVQGGQTVTVRGSKFLSLDRANPDTVKFGDVAATRFAVKSDKELTAMIPPGTAGTVPIKVTGPGGTATSAAVFTYKSALGIEIDDTAASAAGGTLVLGTVSGGTVGATAAAFVGMRITAQVGGVSAKVAWVDASHVRITVPPTTTAAAATVTLFQGGLAGAPSTGAVKYFPVVTRVSPSRVDTAGGNTVQIMGNGFLGVDEEDASAVMIGATPATSFRLVSATQINAVVPEGEMGSAGVTVKTPTGSSQESDAAKVTYRGPLSFDLAGNTQFLRASGGQHILAVTGGTVGETSRAFTAEKISVKWGNTKLTTAWSDATHLKVSLPALTADEITLTILLDVTPGPAVTFPVAPVITNLSATVDTLAGGRSVKITVAGAGTDPTGFRFGDNPTTCTPQPRTITVFVCPVPAATEAGPVAVSFTSGDGVPSRYTPSAAFSYSELD
jgi:hypothetical protein